MAYRQKRLGTQPQFAIVTILVAKLLNLVWNARNFNFNHVMDYNLFDWNIKQVGKHKQVVDCRNRFSTFPCIHCLWILQVRQGTLRLKPWQTCLPPSGVIKTKNCTVSDLMPLRARANVNNFQLCKRRLVRRICAPVAFRSTTGLWMVTVLIWFFSFNKNSIIFYACT